MNDRTGSGISQKVEEAVSGLVRFLAKFFRTHWFIFRHPISFGRHVIDGIETTDDFVAPYTYLAFGGFIFTIAISAIPYGALAVFNDGIWKFDGIVDSIQQRWQEAISLTTLLLASFPVLLTVSFLSNIYARILYSQEIRIAIVDVSAYAFGFATFFYFLVYILSAFGFLLGHFGIDIERFEKSAAFVPVTLGALLIVPIVSLGSPLLFMLQSARALEKHKPSRFSFRIWLCPIYFILVFQLISLTASIPAALSSHEKSKLPSQQIISQFADIPFLVLANDWQETNSGILTFTVVINNRTKEVYVNEVADMWVTLAFANDNLNVRIRHPETELSTGRIQTAVVLEPGTADLLKFSVPLKFDQHFHKGLAKMVELQNNSEWSSNPDFSVPYSKLKLYFDPKIAGDRVTSEAQVLLQIEQ